MQDALASARAQLADVRQWIKMSDQEFDSIKLHDQVVERKIQFKSDSGEVINLPGFRAQHSRVLGAYKGGIRFHPSVSREEVMALSMWMSWKTALVDLPLGGGKGGVVVDPDQLSETELESLSKAYATSFADIIGPRTDVPAPDVNTNSKVMSWMVEAYREYAKKNQIKHPEATFTGKPETEGGSAGRTEATGYGGFYVLEELRKDLKREPEEITIAVQGIGNVGYYFAQAAQEAGYKVVAISDSKAAVCSFDPSQISLDRKSKRPKLRSLDVQALLDHKNKHGSVAGVEQTTELSGTDLLHLPVDILVPAALDNVITAENVDQIQANYILELANGPISDEADDILRDSHIEIVPDILANAGGVIVSYFEWQQNISQEKWSQTQVLDQLKEKMVKAYRQVVEKRNRIGKESISMRQAAYVVAIERILQQNRSG